MRISFGAGLVIGLGLLTASAMATPVTLTFGEVDTQTLDGLTVSKGGEDFTFGNPAGDLAYNATVTTGNLTYLAGNEIAGLNEFFYVDFSVPVDSIKFGFAELTGSPQTGVQVTLSTGEVLSFNLTKTDPFAEGQFSWSGAPVTGFSVLPVDGPVSIGFDNLTVNTVVPEPVSLSLLGIGLAGVSLVRRQRSRLVSRIEEARYVAVCLKWPIHAQKHARYALRALVRSDTN